MASPRTEFLAGTRALLPIVVGVVPFALISGVAAVDAGIPPSAALGMSVFVFAGAAQIVASQLIREHTPAFIIVLTALVVNLRFVMYSASMAPYLARINAGWKWLLGYALTDQVYAISVTRFAAQPETSNKHWFIFGGSLLMWVVWQIASAVGIFLGTQVPASWSLDFAIVLSFLAILVPAIKDRATLLAGLSAGVTAVLTASLPFRLNLLIGALIGIAVGVLVEARRV